MILVPFEGLFSLKAIDTHKVICYTFTKRREVVIMLTVGTPLLLQLFILMLMVVLVALILVIPVFTVRILIEIVESIRENWNELYGKDRFYD